MQAEEYLTPSVAKAIAQIAADAGRAIMEIYEQPAAWNVEVKGDTSPLTQADLKANEIILHELTRLAGEIPVLSEESSWTGGDATTYWAVDPLDGTKEFLKRNGEFTVNIALVVEGVTRMGVICAPALNALWAGVVQGASAVEHTHWAARAQLLDLDAQSVAACIWQQIAVQSGALLQATEAHLGVGGSSGSTVQAMSAPPLRMVGSRSHGSNDYPAWVAPLVTGANMIERGSSLKFCLIAQGDADIYVRMGPTCIWDTAAGHAILSAAGGEVVHAETGDPLNYSVPSQALNPNFVAYGSSRFGLR